MKEYKFIIPLAVLFIAFVTMQVLIPKPLSWKQSFSGKDKIPYGSEALYLLSQDIFPGKTITPVRQSIYQQLNNYDTKQPANYIFITNELNLSKTDANQLIDFSNNGGSVFIAATNFTGSFADSLNLTTFAHYIFNPADTNATDSLGLQFVNQNLNSQEFPLTFKSEIVGSYFESYDTAKTEVLAHNTLDEPTFIKIRKGKGNFYLTTTPLLFTNYYVLDQNGATFISKSLSHLPVSNVLWDEYYKPGTKKINTPLQFILSETSLKWAYFIALFSVLCFAIFTAKRKQRIIPIIIPEPNQTVEFAETIGKLYQNYGNFKDIAEKRILYLFDQIKLKYNFRIDAGDEDFVTKIASKTGIDQSLLISLHQHIRYIKTQNQISEGDLMKLNTLLDGFYNVIKSKYGK